MTHYVAVDCLNALCRQHICVSLGHSTRRTVNAPRSGNVLDGVEYERAVVIIPLAIQLEVTGGNVVALVRGGELAN
jgi:hypothetical protein